MRQIKFRGKRVDNGEWVEGSLVNNFWTKAIDGSGVCEIFTPSVLNADCWDDYVNDENSICEVDPATIGQFTGLIDKNGKEIWEGDIVDSHATFENSYLREVVWGKNCGLEFKPITGFNLCKSNEKHFLILGNIHDNPSLLTNK